MKNGPGMAAARLSAAIVLLQLSYVAAVAVANKPAEAVQLKDPVIRGLRPGQVQNNVLVAHSSKKTRRQGIRSRDAAGVPEQLEKWHDGGTAVKSSLSTADVAKLTAGITAAAFTAELHAIVDPDPSRMVALKGNEIAAANIEKSFKALGLTTEIQALGAPLELANYMRGAKSVAGNVIGYMKGTDRANEVVIVACHYDSVNWENLAGAAPGVDDNGSGVALMMLVAKAFAQGTTKPRRSLLFVAFQAEEEGLVGSKKFASLFSTGGAGIAKYGKPVAAIVADEVAWPGRTSATRKVIFETKGRGQATNVVVDTLAHAAQQECQGDCIAKGSVNGFVVNYHGFGSDHISMLDVGIPAVLLIEKDNMYHADTWGHTDKDTFEHIDPVFGASTTRVALEAVARLATPAA